MHRHVKKSKIRKIKTLWTLDILKQIYRFYITFFLMNSKKHVK